MAHLMTGCHNIYAASQLCYVLLYARRSNMPRTPARTSQRTYSLCSITAVKHAKNSSRPQRLLPGNHSVTHSLQGSLSVSMCVCVCVCVCVCIYMYTHTHICRRMHFCEELIIYRFLNSLDITTNLCIAAIFVSTEVQPIFKVGL